MLCKQCGNELVSGATFCNICGAKIEQEKPKKKKKWLPILAAVVAVIVIGAILLLRPWMTEAEKMAEKYLSAVFEEDAEAIEACFHEVHEVDGEDDIKFNGIEDYEIQILDSTELVPAEVQSNTPYNAVAVADRAESELDDVEVGSRYVVLYSCVLTYEGKEYKGVGELSVAELDGELSIYYYMPMRLSMERAFYEAYYQ